MNMNIQTLDLTVGPLCYRLLAHDDWAVDLLDRIRATIDIGVGTDKNRKQIHLLRHPLSDLAIEQIGAELLPKELAACVDETLPTSGWHCSGHEILHQLWRHPSSEHLFWTEGRENNPKPFRFHLPWQIILEDILQIGGLIMHGGLAVRGKDGCLFTAPPGGGKSTALSNPSKDWQVLADDAALIWPESNDRFMASSLPTWSVLIGDDCKPRQIAAWSLSRQVPVSAIMLLEKANDIRLTWPPAIEAAYPLYRACSEYPAVILSRWNLRSKIFHNSCALARAVPVWRLELPRNANIWPFINEQIDHRHAAY